MSYEWDPVDDWESLNEALREIAFSLQGLMSREPTIIGSNEDLDDLQENGLYSWVTGSQPTNIPTGMNYGVLLHIQDPNGRGVQICWGDDTSGKAWVRREDSGTYYAWTQLH